MLRKLHSDQFQVSWGACMMQLYTAGPALNCSHGPKAIPHLLSSHDHGVASLHHSTPCSCTHDCARIQSHCSGAPSSTLTPIAIFTLCNCNFF